MTKKRASEADPFDVWGKPPQALANGLTAHETNLLRKYVEAVTHNCYRMAFDMGVGHGLDIVNCAVETRLREHVAKMGKKPSKVA